ncbi:MAG: SMC-Scp complex subunit ScpB [Candidatus Synoicihabitans palmerolidicus]|nr:SMC-Scp complex subunit ScpB [Candidatus Synoicihabitans palmerolidicus]
MAFHFQSVLKALLFSSGQPLSIKDIQSVFSRYYDQRVPPPAEAKAPADTSSPGADDVPEVDAEESSSDESVPELVTAAQVREAMEALEIELRETEDVYLLVEGAQGYRIVCNPRYARWVRALRNEPPPAKLSQSALETLAVVSYRQPVTRSEIEAVRGVSADAGLNKLLERELIYVTGRAELPGRPLQYGTTEKFLEFVGVKSLVELPASDVLSPRQIDEWLKDAMNPTTPGDQEMGLPLEEGESPMQDEAYLEVSEGNASTRVESAEAAESEDGEDSTDVAGDRGRANA